MFILTQTLGTLRDNEGAMTICQWGADRRSARRKLEYFVQEYEGRVRVGTEAASMFCPKSWVMA